MSVGLWIGVIVAVMAGVFGVLYSVRAEGRGKKK
jgi:hypothetical protein